MENNLKGMIEVVGETAPSDLPILPEEEGAWQELLIPETIAIPCYKPELEQIIKVIVLPQIDCNYLINTPNVDNNLENEQSTGKKLVVEGSLKQEIVYVANKAEQSLHSVEFTVPFSTYIVVERSVNLSDKFEVEIFIEDIFVKKAGLKTIFKNIAIFLLAEQR